MKTVTCIQGIALALLMAAIAPVLSPIATIAFGYTYAERGIIAACVVLYLWILTALSQRRSGRLLCAVSVPLAVWVTLLLPVSLMTFTLLVGCIVWGTRVVLGGTRVVDAVIEGGFVVAAFCVLVWCVSGGSGCALTAWSAFLVLAARPLVAFSAGEGSTRCGGWQAPAASTPNGEGNSAFEDAYRTAQAALRQIAGVP